MEPYITTIEGLDRLKARLRQIREVDRPQNVQDIEEARAHGDLRENAEYHAAKEKQGLLAEEMSVLEDKIARAQVVDPSTLAGDKIVFGAKVTLVNVDTDEEVVYEITSEDEADARTGRISYNAPLARALLGHELDDEITVMTPGGKRVYEVVAISFGE